MDNITVYLGVGFVMLCFALSVVYLANNGLVLRRFRFVKGDTETEIAFDALPLGGKSRLSANDIVFSEIASKECIEFGYEKNEIIAFILKERGRHPSIYFAMFSSLPLIYSKHVLIFSWDKSKIFIEKIIKRNEVYSTFKKWSAALAYYRQASILPYRLGSPDCLLQPHEFKRTFETIKRLVKSIEAFLSSTDELDNTEELDLSNLAFQPLLDEIEFAINDGRVDIAVSRMEILLSSIHKLLLEYVPGAEKNSYDPLKNTIESKTKGIGKNILIVDDSRLLATSLEKVISNKLFELYKIKISSTVCTNSVDALVKLVNEEYDFVITDLVMPQVSGYEIIDCAIKIKRIKKIITMSGYNEIDISKIEEYDPERVAFLKKPFGVKDLIEIIHNDINVSM